jgi:hypothetical protein
MGLYDSVFYIENFVLNFVSLIVKWGDIKSNRNLGRLKWKFRDPCVNCSWLFS